MYTDRWMFATNCSHLRCSRAAEVLNCVGLDVDALTETRSLFWVRVFRFVLRINRTVRRVSTRHAYDMTRSGPNKSTGEESRHNDRFCPHHCFPTTIRAMRKNFVDEGKSAIGACSRQKRRRGRFCVGS